MRGVRMGLVGVGLLSMLTVGCENKVKKENMALHQQNRELQSARDDAEARLRAAPDPQAHAQLQQENARLQAEMAQLQESLRNQPSGEAKDPALEGIETSYNAQAGTLTVNLPGDVLFASGKTDLKPQSKQTLDKIVGAIKKDYAGKRIVIKGHTDTDPINKTKNQYADNYELGFKRAHSVMNYLTKAGVQQKSIELATPGPNDPKPTKPQSRRVEIVVYTRS